MRISVLGDQTSIAFTFLEHCKDFLEGASVEVQNQSAMTELLAEALLNEFKDSDQDLVVAYENLVKSNNANFSPDDMKTHTHEESDTMIALHILDAVKESKVKAINVWSPDTDILILLMDVAARGHLG